jgi:hypothetical protein
MTDTDYIDLGDFPTQEAALAHIEGLAANLNEP